MTYEEFRAYLAGQSADDVDAITAAAYRALRRKMRFRATLRLPRRRRRRDSAGKIATAIYDQGGKAGQPTSTASGENLTFGTRRQQPVWKADFLAERRVRQDSAQ